MSEERRQIVLDKLTKSGEPITGSDLADICGVSRQVIVQDIAILRAKGIPVLATSSGYMMHRNISEDRLIKTIISKHDGFDRVEEELLTIVDFGGKIIDVIVEHSVYGEIIGTLHISTKADISNFIKKVKESDSKPLSILTNGEHIHTIEVPSEKVFKLIIDELKQKGFVE